MTPRGLLGIGVPVGRTSGSRYWDIEEDVRGFVVVCDSCVDVAFPAGFEHVVVLLDLDALRRDLSAETLEALERGAKARRVPAARRTIVAFARWGMRMLDDASKFSHAHELASIGRSLEEDVLRWVGVVAEGGQPVTGDTPTQGRERALVRALDVLRDIHPNELTVPMVVAAARVSQRTLEYAFRERFGMSVLSFIRLRRLHLARRDLLFAHKSDIRVADVAARHGFGAHGRFSGAYWRQFGEHPSETLRTTPPRRQPDLTFTQPRSR
jgi:AraC family ethanolamine operon transcriptional activator